MNALGELVRAEFIKFRTTRTSLALVGAFVVLVIVLAGLNAGLTHMSTLRGPGGTRNILSVGGTLAAFFALCCGVIGMAGEERHKLLGLSLAAVPERWPLVVAKVVAYLAIGAAIGLLGAILCTAVGAPWASARGAGLSLGSGLAHKIWIGSIVGGALFAAIGVGLGALLRDQVLALAAGLGWLLLVDSIVGGFAPDVAKFFPRGGLSSVTRSDTSHVLPMGIGALLLIAYAAAFAVAGAVALRRRNVT